MISQEARPGLAIIMTALLALILCNSGYYDLYQSVWSTEVSLKIGKSILSKNLLKIINEGLMALFFLLITIEVRYEITHGFLNKPKYVALPLVAALGGMVVPAAVYLWFNTATPFLDGWAIPVATDIAFSLACLMLLGKGFSPKLRVFLLSVAIFDDLGAILIIALYYTEKVSLALLLTACFLSLFMWVMSAYVRQLRPFFLLGTILWVVLLYSGLHATLTGCIVALVLPMAHDSGKRVKQFYQEMLPWVQYGILPLFAFANSGVVLDFSEKISPVFWGIALGLVVGKPLGIVAFTYLAEGVDLIKLPSGIDYRHILGVSLLCGVGFTMSLFIAMLAFEDASLILLRTVKLGVLFGSLAAGFLGMLVLKFSKEEKEYA